MRSKTGAIIYGLTALGYEFRLGDGGDVLTNDGRTFSRRTDKWHSFVASLAGTMARRFNIRAHKDIVADVVLYLAERYPRKVSE